jgi:hypothetical protein
MHFYVVFLRQGSQVHGFLCGIPIAGEPFVYILSNIPIAGEPFVYIFTWFSIAGGRLLCICIWYCYSWAAISAHSYKVFL